MMSARFKSSYLLLLLCVTACSMLRCRHQNHLPLPDEDNGGLVLPASFRALVVVDSIGPARHLAVNDNGDIYVKLRLSKGDKGNIAIRDVNGDGRADSVQRWGDFPNDGSMATGMRIHDGYLYFSSEKVVYKQKIVPGEFIPQGKPEVVITDDHPHGSHWHITKPVAFDNKGKMYVPFGAPSNACQDLIRTPGGTPGFAGLDPCPELELHGGIWEFEAGKNGLVQSNGRKFATGLRSIVAMAWHPVDNKLYAVMHGRDDLHLLWPDKFSPWQNAILPSEEFIQVSEGDDFGWPYSYYDQVQRKNVLAPEYGGDGKMPARTAGVKNPVIGFPGHWAPNDLLFYTGDQFPERYRNGAFIAFHGSTNRAPYPQSGYFVCFVPFKDGKFSGEWEVFADGFAGMDTIVNVSDAKARPMGLAQGPDGSLYISDSRNGKIWRIIYERDKKDFKPDDLLAMEKRKLSALIRTPDEQNDNLYKGKALPGSQVYNIYCVACHQRNGKGDGSRFPPLDSSEWVMGDKARLISVVLNGLNGPIEVKGKSYNNIMPQHSFLKDEDIAEVTTYIRRRFNNDSTAITKEEVAAVRKKSKT
jgi:glucose/arabinose dehydrogenase/mono/diheme cytochrome c family protein